MEIVSLAVLCVTVLAGSPLLLAEHIQRKVNRKFNQTSRDDETSL